MTVHSSTSNPFVVATGSCDNTAKVWDIRQSEPVFSYRWHQEDVNVVRFLPASKFTLYTGSSDGYVRMLDTRTFRPIGEYQADSSVQSLTVSNSGRFFILGTEGGDIEVWDVFNDKGPVQQIPGHSDKVSAVGLNEVGNLLISGGFDGDLVMWQHAPR